MEYIVDDCKSAYFIAHVRLNEQLAYTFQNKSPNVFWACLELKVLCIKYFFLVIGNLVAQ